MTQEITKQKRKKMKTRIEQFVDVLDEIMTEEEYNGTTLEDAIYDRISWSGETETYYDPKREI